MPTNQLDLIVINKRATLSLVQSLIVEKDFGNEIY